jgi:hypothetical protein
MDESELTPYEVEQERLRDVARLILPLESKLCTGTLIGGLAIVALWGVKAGWYVSLVLLLAVPFLWRKALQFSLKSMLVSKEQEQKNVWRAIREANNVPPWRS